MRARNLKLPRGKLPEPLANALRLFGYNWQGRRSLNGKIWTIYRRGRPRKENNRWMLHSDADPEQVVIWLVAKERGETRFVSDRKLLEKDVIGYT